MDANNQPTGPEPEPGAPDSPSGGAASGAGADSQDEESRFAAAWAEIVAELTAGPDPVGLADEGTEPEPSEPGGGTEESRTGTPEGLAALFEPLRRARPPQPPAPEAGEPAPADWYDEGHFTPPPPPDLPEGTPLHRLAWAGTLGGPAILLGAAFTGVDLPQFVALVAGLATLAGFATLIWLLPESREDSGWDDGAQL